MIDKQEILTEMISRKIMLMKSTTKMLQAKRILEKKRKLKIVKMKNILMKTTLVSRFMIIWMNDGDI